MSAWLEQNFGNATGLPRAKNYVLNKRTSDDSEYYIKPNEEVNTGTNQGDLTYKGSLTNVIGIVKPTIDGKNSIYYQPLAPAEASTDDIWFDTDNNFLMYRWNGSSWINSTLNGNNITAGTIDANQVNVSNINAGSITTGTLTAISIQIATGNSWSLSGQMYISEISAVGSIYSTSSINASTITARSSLTTGLNANINCGGDTIANYFEAGQGSGGGVGNAYGLSTGNYKAYIGGGVEPFTGQHIGYSKENVIVGDIVESEDAWTININQTLVHLKTAGLLSKKVFGVVNSVDEDTLVHIRTNPLLSVQEKEEIVIADTVYNEDGSILKEKETMLSGTGIWTIKDEYKVYIQYLVDNNFNSLSVNALGEGGINVCEANGDILNGDYITSSSVPGKGMKQDDDLLHSYTVAKALENVIWADEIVGEGACFEQDGIKCKMIACTYHCG